GKLLLTSKPMTFGLLSLLCLGVIELHKSTFARLSEAIRNKSITQASRANTDSVARFEFQNWQEFYEMASYLGPSWWRYLRSGDPSDLRITAEDGAVKGWVYLDAGEKAASVASNWHVNISHIAGDSVWLLDLTPAISDLVLPGGWHSEGVPRSAGEPSDSVLLRIRRLSESYSKYLA